MHLLKVAGYSIKLIHLRIHLLLLFSAMGYNLRGFRDTVCKHLGQYSLQIKTWLGRVIKQHYSNIQLKVTIRSTKCIGSLFSFKDRIPTLMSTSVIYKFQCPGCHALYYGKASRNLITRCREHLVVKKAGLKIRASPSAIGGHISRSGHAASFKDFSILDRANNEFDLLIHESPLIIRDRPDLNSQQSSIPLVLF